MKLNNELFIDKARQIHGDKYDYSKVDYKTAREKVAIICSKHGVFWKTPDAHMRGEGCPICSKEKNRVTTQKFIEKAKQVHGDRYDYSKVDYKGAEIPVTIICSKHGEFQQKPHEHLRGGNCPKCSPRARLTTQDFIERAREIHGDKYDYSKVNYINNHTKVCIVCPNHGEFWQIPSAHLLGQGCPKCGSDLTGMARKLTTEKFIEKAILKHGDKYDYSNVNYVNSNIPVSIICPIHGEFLQTPHKHLCGHGCPDCGVRNNISELYILKILQKEFPNVEYQKIFPFLRNGSGVQKLDYYLPDYNVGIELNGRQHYMPVDLYGGEEEYKKIVKRDIMKNKLCKENGIKIYYYTLPSMKSYINDNYIDKVYTSIIELINDIKNNKK